MKSLFIVLLFASGLAQAAPVEINVTLWPGGSFVAKGSEIEGHPYKMGGDHWRAMHIVLDLRSLTTDKELRDKHMKEKYFEVGRFPHAELVKAEGKDGKFEGILKVHGVPTKIDGTYSADDEALRATFQTKPSSFKIQKAEYMGVGVEDNVTVKVTLPFGPAPAGGGKHKKKKGK